MMTMTEAVARDEDVLGGTLCFRGTRVPVRNLFDYLEGGNNIDYFLSAFSWVSREQVLSVLEHTASKLETDATSAG